jgi:hypothetical protein
VTKTPSAPLSTTFAGVSVVRFSSVIRQLRSARKDLTCALPARSSSTRVALPCDSGYSSDTLVNEMFPCDNLLRCTTARCTPEAGSAVRPAKE